MKCSEIWLREWVKTELDRHAICELFTMSGLEVDELIPASAKLEHVVTGQVKEVSVHPKANHLKLCRVDVGKQSLQIVCGANNVIPNLKVAVALPGAKIADQVIQAVSIQGVTSEGMLCSAKELGLSEEQEGILSLPAETAVGKAVIELLQLDDFIFDISITPNRGDCLSIQGLGRELAALSQSQFTPIEVPATQPANDQTVKLKIDDPKACPAYAGRIIQNVDVSRATPLWMQERLRRSGLRSINPIVDVMNYVMIELGQPLHAFDKNLVGDEVIVRLSKTGERLTLLDGQVCELDDQTLIIADQQSALAIAGIMGGLDSSITAETKQVFLESAYFDPRTIARSKQYYQLQSDAAYRFERGVDPELQVKALERATQLILEIVGGTPGPMILASNKNYLPEAVAIQLSADQLNRLTGLQLVPETIKSILTALHFNVESVDAGSFLVRAPAFRFDVSRAEDLIEEVARVNGYDKIPVLLNRGELIPSVTSIFEGTQSVLRDSLCKQGFHEVITYSFVEPSLQALFYPAESLALDNPISSEMSVMRASLIPGLVNVLAYNLHRQQSRIALFELATCFQASASGVDEVWRCGGLLSGLAAPEQWGIPARQVDFYDLKAQVESALTYLQLDADISYHPTELAYLHPGQSAAIHLKGQCIGFLGKLHPRINQTLDLKAEAYVFELDINPLLSTKNLQYQPISKFPEIRRDVALLVKQTIPAERIQATIRKSAGDWLKDVFIFDVYQGQPITEGYKSVAVGLILQDPTRTLVDEEVAKWIEQVMTALTEQLGAELRS